MLSVDFHYIVANRLAVNACEVKCRRQIRDGHRPDRGQAIAANNLATAKRDNLIDQPRFQGRGGQKSTALDQNPGQPVRRQTLSQGDEINAAAIGGRWHDQ